MQDKHLAAALARSAAEPIEKDDTQKQIMAANKVEELWAFQLDWHLVLGRHSRLRQLSHHEDTKIYGAVKQVILILFVIHEEMCC